jgi:hypothetical protein
LYSSPRIILSSEAKEDGWTGHVARMVTIWDFEEKTRREKTTRKTQT